MNSEVSQNPPEASESYKSGEGEREGVGALFSVRQQVFPWCFGVLRVFTRDMFRKFGPPPPTNLTSRPFAAALLQKLYTETLRVVRRSCCANNNTAKTTRKIAEEAFFPPSLAVIRRQKLFEHFETLHSMYIHTYIQAKEYILDNPCTIVIQKKNVENYFKLAFILNSYNGFEIN